jgi:hypothetical protein
MTVTLPIRLLSEANLRQHWAEKARRARAQRLATWGGVRAAGPGRLRWPLDVTITRVAPRQLDDDNLRGACKAVRDGIADALGLPSDRDPRVVWLYAQEKSTRPGEYAVRISIVSRETSTPSAVAGSGRDTSPAPYPQSPAGSAPAVAEVASTRPRAPGASVAARAPKRTTRTKTRR